VIQSEKYSTIFDYELYSTDYSMHLLTEQWFLANRANLTKDKTVDMIFTLKEFAGGVEYSQQTKCLGINVDMQLTWHAHGEQMATKISRNTYISLFFTLV
jgi:hypothetical protein